MNNIEKPSFEEFYSRYYPQIVRYICKKIGHPEESEDLAGDVFCICYQKYAEYDPQKSSPATWLYVIVNNKLKNYYRDRKIFANLEDISDELLADPEDSVTKAVWIEELRNILADALLTLPERSQKIVILKYFHNKHSDEIGKLMHMSPVNVRVTLSRAVKKIHTYLLTHGWNGEL